MGRRTVISNYRTFLAIAREALRASEEADRKHKTPKPDGTGHIIIADPERQSFKQSLVAIAFVGAFLDAVLYWIGRDVLGKSQYKKVTEGSNTYEHCLAKIFEKLCISDDDLINDCARFREARNELLHEKAIPIEELGKKGIRVAQKEAANAVSVAIRIVERLKIAI